MHIYYLRMQENAIEEARKNACHCPLGTGGISRSASLPACGIILCILLPSAHLAFLIQGFRCMLQESASLNTPHTWAGPNMTELKLFGDFHAVTLRHSTAYRTGLSFSTTIARRGHAGLAWYVSMRICKS